jgi:chromosome segregation ATPase
MEEQLMNSEHALVERLEALNTILAGLRGVMVSNDDKVIDLADRLNSIEAEVSDSRSKAQELADLKEKVQALSQSAKESINKDGDSDDAIADRLEKVNVVMGELRKILDSKLEMLLVRIEHLEAFEKSMVGAAASEKVDSEALDSLGHRCDELFRAMSDLKTAMDSKINPDDIYPQIDEIKLLQETVESRLHGLSQFDGPAEVEELKNRQGDHHLRLQQLEASKEKAELERVQGEANLREVQAKSLQEFHQKLEELESKIQDTKGGWHEEFELSLKGHEDRLGDLESWKTEALAFGAKLEAKFESEMTELKGSRSDLDSNLEQMKGLLNGETAELKGAFEESLTEIRHVMDALSKRDVSARAKESELQKAVDRLSEDMAGIWDKWSSEKSELLESVSAEVKSLVAEVESKSEELRQLRIGQARLSEEVKFETEKRAEGMTRELVLARDHMEDQQRRVDEDLEDIKKNQKELGGVREQLLKEEEAHRQSKREIRHVKEQMDGLRADLVRQKSFAFSGVAAAFILSVAVSFLMMPQSYDLGGNTHVASTLNIEPTPELIPLDAPEVDLLGADTDLSEGEALAETLVEELAPEPIVEEEVASDVVEPMVTTAFARNDEERYDESSEDNLISASRDQSEKEYVVQEGDSLWKIARKHPGQGSVIDRIEKIKKDNQLNSANIRPGRVLRIYL